VYAVGRFADQVCPLVAFEPVAIKQAAMLRQRWPPASQADLQLKLTYTGINFFVESLFKLG